MKKIRSLSSKMLPSFELVKKYFSSGDDTRKKFEESNSIKDIFLQNKDEFSVEMIKVLLSNEDKIYYSYGWLHPSELLLKNLFEFVSPHTYQKISMMFIDKYDFETWNDCIGKIYVWCSSHQRKKFINIIERIQIENAETLMKGFLIKKPFFFRNYIFSVLNWYLPIPLIYISWCWECCIINRRSTNRIERTEMYNLLKNNFKKRDELLKKMFENKEIKYHFHSLIKNEKKKLSIAISFLDDSEYPRSIMKNILNLKSRGCYNLEKVNTLEDTLKSIIKESGRGYALFVLKKIILAKTIAIKKNIDEY